MPLRHREQPSTDAAGAGVLLWRCTAITLGDVILFKSERLAETDLKVWAHELTHVMQYERWGVDGFADRYVRDSAAVEQEAIDNANRFMTWRTEHVAR